MDELRGCNVAATARTEPGGISAFLAAAESEHRWSNLLQILLSVISIRRAGVQDEEGRRGSVRVRLRRTAEGLAELSVEDDGVGLPSVASDVSNGAARREGGHGLRLLGGIAAQAGAEATVSAGDNGRGTTARLRFAPTSSAAVAP